MFPFIIVPLPHSGQDFPTNSLSDGIVGAGVAEEAFFREVPAFFFGCLTVAVVAVFVAVSSIVVTRRFVLSLKTLCTISLTICFNSFRKVVAS